jgi:hypothetical protein
MLSGERGLTRRRRFNFGFVYVNFAYSAQEMEGSASVMLDTRWGKRGFQAVDVGGTKRWLTWSL